MWNWTKKKYHNKLIIKKIYLLSICLQYNENGDEDLKRDARTQRTTWLVQSQTIINLHSVRFFKGFALGAKWTTECQVFSSILMFMVYWQKKTIKMF